MSSDEQRASFDSDTLEAAGFPAISFERLQVGDEFQSDDRLIRPQDVQAYAFAVEDHDPWFFGREPFGHAVIHPTLLANQALFLRHNRYVVPAGLHARMVFEFLEPIPLGTRTRTIGRVVDKYIRRDKPYMVTEYETSGEDGRVHTRGRFVQMLFSGDKAPPAGSGPRPEPEPTRGDPAITRAEGRNGTLEVGQQLDASTRVVTQRQIDVYSGVKPLSIHTDESWAQAKGFRTTIAQGMMSTAYVSALMTSAVGKGFIAGGRMDTRFLRPVHQGDALTVSGTVTGFHAEGTQVRVLVDVAVHNQDGQQTLAGTASALAKPT